MFDGSVGFGYKGEAVQYCGEVFYNTTVRDGVPALADFKVYHFGSSMRGSTFDWITDMTVEANSSHEAAERIYRQMNAVDGTERCAQLQVRSMSIGDMVRLNNGKVLVCRSIGFEWVKPETGVLSGARLRWTRRQGNIDNSRSR